MRVIVSIVIVNWNTEELLRACLNSIYKTMDKTSIEVIVVDNASSDNSVDMVQREFPMVRLVINQANLGFAKANNIAFPMCSAPYVMLLNSDTTVYPGAVETLTQFLDTHLQVGAVGPKIVHPRLRLKVLSCGNQPNVQTIFNHYFGLSYMFPHFKAFRGTNLYYGLHDKEDMAVEWLSGACLVVRRSIIESVGGLSERWFMYAEDMEWCRRIINAGWTLYSVPEAKVEHWVGASTDKNEKVKTMWIQSNRSYYIQSENPSRFKLLLFDWIMILGLFSRVLLYLLRGLIDQKQRVVWWTEARKFQEYTFCALTESRR